MSADSNLNLIYNKSTKLPDTPIEASLAKSQHFLFTFPRKKALKSGVYLSVLSPSIEAPISLLSTKIIDVFESYD